MMDLDSAGDFDVQLLQAEDSLRAVDRELDKYPAYDARIAIEHNRDAGRALLAAIRLLETGT